MAAGSTYTPIATQTLGSAAASVTFSSISGAYTDLVLVVTGGASTDANLRCQVNSDSASNYSRTNLGGTGASAVSSRLTSQTYLEFNYQSYLQNNLNLNSVTHFMNYSNSTTFKTVLSRTNSAALGADVNVNLWRSTSAISTIYLFSSAGTFNTGSTFTLYGIVAA